MNKVIRNVLYNTETAELVERQFYPFDRDDYDFGGHFVSMYRKTNGKHFLYIEAPEVSLIFPIDEKETELWQNRYEPRFELLMALYKILHPQVAKPGQAYDKACLEDASKLITCNFSDDETYHVVTLYRNKANEYMFHVVLRDDCYEDRDEVCLVSDAEVRAWAEEYLTVDEYVEIFGPVAE